jgi:hypothetical protein
MDEDVIKRRLDSRIEGTRNNGPQYCKLKLVCLVQAVHPSVTVRPDNVPKHTHQRMNFGDASPAYGFKTLPKVPRIQFR